MRFVNTGKSDGKTLAAAGVAPGAAIVCFPGSGIRQVVEAGEHIDLPGDLDEAAVRRACPSLALVVEQAVAVDAAPVDPAPADKRVRGKKE